MEICKFSFLRIDLNQQKEVLDRKKLWLSKTKLILARKVILRGTQLSHIIFANEEHVVVDQSDYKVVRYL